MWYYEGKYTSANALTKECVPAMRKRLFALALSLVMLFSFSTSVYARGGRGSNTTDSADGSASIDGTTYYYDQFDNDAYRTVYKQICSAAETFHASDQNASYQDGGYYTAFVLSVDNKNWEVLGNEGMAQVVNAVIADNPKYFWLSDDYSCQQKVSGELSYTELTIECYSLYANGTTRSVCRNHIENSISNYASSIPDGAEDYEKVYLIHNKIIDSTYYAGDITSKNNDNVYAYTADGVLNEDYKSAVTYGYAKAFKAVMDSVGVPCVYIEGQNSDLLDDSTETQKRIKEEGYIDNCAWNAVYLDDDWYLINLGLDDPVTATGKEALSYTYFNITDQQAANLTPITTRLKGIPSCTGTTYCLEKVQQNLESGGLWTKSTYNFIDKILDTYGLSVVLISVGIILLLVVSLIKHIHKKSKVRKKENVKKTKTTVIDNSELDNELRKPPIS